MAGVPENLERMKNFGGQAMSTRIFFIFSALLPIWIQGATFTQGPEASLQGGKITVAFTVSAATDVEVAIVDTPGIIVRHLAAGVLGGTYNPPEPLVPGLSQTIEWDGKDDYGNWAVNGPYRVRVRLGVTVEYKRSLSTRVMTTGSRSWGPDSSNPLATYLSTDHPLYERDSSLYEEETVLDIAVDDNTDKLYLKLGLNQNWGTGAVHTHLGMYNGLTGDFLGILDRLDWDLPICMSEDRGTPVLSWDGRFIYYSEGSFNVIYCPDNAPLGNIVRFNTDGSQAPWAATGKAYVSGMYNGDQHTRGHAVGPDGSLYALHYAADNTAKCPNCTLFTEPSGADTRYQTPYALSIIRNGVIDEPMKVKIYAPVNCVKVDLQGNMYVAAGLRPSGLTVPDFVEADSLAGSSGESFSQTYWAEKMYGSILKFDSTGGAIDRFDDAGALVNSGDYQANRPLVAKGGFQWAHYGFSHVLSHADAHKCFCNVSAFDVDRFGRIFYPNTFQHEIVAIDNNRNMIWRLKNRDLPEVAIGLGHQVEVTDNNLYVADWINNQIVVFGLTPETEEIVNLPLSVESGTGLPNTGKALASYPNPFNPATRILLHIQEQWRGKAEVKIFDVNNRLVKTLFSGSAKPGLYTLAWDGKDNSGKKAASGIFVCRLKCGNVVKTRKLLMAR
jgi:flagellar hook assembly protein FlgD